MSGLKRSSKIINYKNSTMFYKTFNSVRKFQQGGGMPLLNPNRLRMNLPGLDPNLYKVDISPMSEYIQLQTLDATEDYRRQQAALQREKMQHQKDLLDRKQQMELEKMIFKSLIDDISTSGSPANSKGQPIIPGNDPRNSVRFRDQFNQQKQAEIEATEELLKITNSPHSDQKNGLLLKQMEKLRQVKQQGPSMVDLDVDKALFDRVTSIALNPDTKSKLKINTPVFNDWVDKRTKFYDKAEGSDAPGYYSLGIEPPNLYYDEDVARKKFDAIYNNVNTRIPTSKDIKEENGIVKQVEQFSLLDSEAAADILTESIISDPDILAYIQDKYNIKLNPGDQSPEQKTAIRNIMLPMLKADDIYAEKLSKEDETYKTKMPVQRTPAGGGRVSSGGGRSSGGAAKSVNQTSIDRFRNKHFNTTTKTFDGASAASDPQLDVIASAIVDNMYPDLKNSKAQEVTQRSALMKSITSSFLASGGDPNSQYFLNELRKKLDEVLTKDLDFIRVDKINKELKQNILIQNQAIRDRNAASQQGKSNTDKKTSGSKPKTTGASGINWLQ